MAKTIKTCMDIPRIQKCEASECAYNKEMECHAVAITVGNSSSALCDTFLNRSRKGGVAGLTGGVGACKMDSCRHNSELECTIDPGINVAFKANQARCSSFSRR